VVVAKKKGHGDQEGRDVECKGCGSSRLIYNRLVVLWWAAEIHVYCSLMTTALTDCCVGQTGFHLACGGHLTTHPFRIWRCCKSTLLLLDRVGNRTLYNPPPTAPIQPEAEQSPNVWL